MSDNIKPPKPPSSRQYKDCLGVLVPIPNAGDLPKVDLKSEIERLQRITKRLVAALIALVLFVPWSAIFFGATVNIWLGIAVYIMSFVVWKFLKKNGII